MINNTDFLLIKNPSKKQKCATPKCNNTPSNNINFYLTEWEFSTGASTDGIIYCEACVSEHLKGRNIMIILMPAPGKKYNCAQEVVKDWEQGESFYLPSKGLRNKNDIKSMKITHRHLIGSEVVVKYRVGSTALVAII